MRRWLMASAAVVAIAAAGPAHADVPSNLEYVPEGGELQELNDSGVSGSFSLEYLDVDGNPVAETSDEVAQLRVRIGASGLEAGQTHAQHIHGLSDDEGNAIDSTVPPATAADDDPDGDDSLLEIGEGAPFYGPVILPLQPFPALADGETSFQFEQTFDLSDDTIFAGDFTAEDLAPLHDRVIVLHGLTVGGQYNPSLPVAAAEIAVPTPTAGVMGLVLLGGMGLMRRRRRA